jgi:hypothetical protein
MAFLSDKILSPDEKDQIKFLASFPKEELLKLIGNGSFVNTDMDGDGMNNYFEKEIAGLPWNVYNGRYILLLCTQQRRVLHTRDKKIFYHSLQMFTSKCCGINRF